MNYGIEEKRTPSPRGEVLGADTTGLAVASRYTPIMRRAQRTAAVWEGRGATARPRESKLSSGVSGVFGVNHTQNIFKDPFGHHYYYYY